MPPTACRLESNINDFTRFLIAHEPGRSSQSRCPCRPHWRARSGVALVVGVGDHLHGDEIGPLPLAPRDAKAMAQLLSDPTVGAFPSEQIALLTDQQASRFAILQHLSKWLPERSRGADLAVIYFACHGIVHEIGQTHEGFLLPFDFVPGNVGASGVPMTEIARWIGAIEANSIVVIMDCCHAGRALNRDGTVFRSQGRDVTIKPAVFQAMSGKGRFLIASCDEGQQSIESTRLKHGLFTYHLLRGLKGAADKDGDGKVGVSELFNYVSTAVARDAREQFHCEQTPWTNATYTEEVFLSWARRSDAATSKRHRFLEDPWKRLGPDGAMAEIEAQLRDRDERWQRTVLSFLRTKRHAATIPALFHFLAVRSEPIRRQTAKIVEKYGWKSVTSAVLEVAGASESEQVSRRLDFILEGLAAIESNSDVITLLDDLIIRLSGAVRTRAIFLLERKQFSLDLERVAKLFREKESPYRIEKVLGHGAFTAAYLATHELAGTSFVVRVLRSKFVDDHSVRTGFLDVSKRAFNYVAPNLVHTREVRGFADCKLYYTVRDFVEGVTLQNVLDEGRKFEPLQIIEILRKP